MENVHASVFTLVFFLFYFFDKLKLDAIPESPCRVRCCATLSVSTSAFVQQPYGSSGTPFTSSLNKLLLYDTTVSPV